MKRDPWDMVYGMIGGVAILFVVYLLVGLATVYVKLLVNMIQIVWKLV